MENNNQKCLVCGRSEISVFLKCTDHFITQESFQIDQCDHCGFLFTADAPAADEIGSYYKSEDYISHSDTQKGLINKLYHLVRNVMLGKKERLIKSLTTGRKLLDIGCGTGHFLNYMQQKGFTCEGIEVDESARNYAIRQFGLRVTGQKTIEAEVTQKYDVITLWHVLEHLHDVENYLKWMHQALKPDGVLLIALPNCSSWDATHYGKFWAAYDVPRHLWHFNPTVFEPFIQRFGFSLKRVKGLPFDAYYNSMMSAKYAHKKGALLQGLFAGFCSNVNSCFNPKKTSSVIYIVKRTGS
jgi:SAM-dependent methyltransferase